MRRKIVVFTRILVEKDRYLYSPRTLWDYWPFYRRYLDVFLSVFFALFFSREKLRKAVKSCEKLRKVVISGVIDVSDKSYFKSWKLRSVVAISLFFSMISVTSVVSFHFRAHREQRKWTICGYVWPCSGSICGESCQANVRCICMKDGWLFWLENVY